MAARKKTASISTPKRKSSAKLKALESATLTKDAVTKDPQERSTSNKQTSSAVPGKSRASDTQQSRRKKKIGSKPSGQPVGYPEHIYAIASPKSLGRVSMFEPGVIAHTGNVSQFYSDEGLIEQAVQRLQDSGFEVLQITPLMINFRGSRETFEVAFSTKLELVDRPVFRSGEEIMSTHIDSMSTDIDGLIGVENTPFAQVLEGVAIEAPMYVNAVTVYPPPLEYWHMNMPGDLSVALNADKAHRGGVTGRGVRIAMVDTGFQKHPYFTRRGYRVAPALLGPGTENPELDEHGHGTGEAANIFATAPDVTLLPVKAATSSGALVNTTGAFNAAASLKPDILSNSWGGNLSVGPPSASQQALAASIAVATLNNTTVVFSAGNGASFGFPGQHPDVISVGGVFMHQDGSIEASNYATGFMSNVYPNRRVPDVSGLVGLKPRAAYIMLPIPPGCIIDRDSAGGKYPEGDETGGEDGWAAFSGTSAAAPQIAGVCALLKQAYGQLTPAEQAGILMSTARDVTRGTNAMGNAAMVSADIATGNGLVDAHKAVLVAKLRACIQPALASATSQSTMSPMPPFFGGNPTLIAEEVAMLERMIVNSDDPLEFQS